MKKIILFLLCCANLFALSTQEKIAKNQSSLNDKKHLEKEINQKIELIAKDIIQSESLLKLTDKNIDRLEHQIADLMKNSKQAEDELRVLIGENQKLVKDKKNLEEKLIHVIAEKFSFYLVADHGYQENEESIIGNEILKRIDGILKNDFKKISDSYKKTNDHINSHNNRIESIKKTLNSLKDKQKSLQKLRTNREAEIVSLKAKRKGYRAQLEKIASQKEEIRGILENLQIVEQEEKEAQIKENEIASEGSEKGDELFVKRIGSSYQKSKVIAYKGPKTIAPLDSYVVKQKFGNYIVPIYNIKSFNESVILSSKTSDAKVKNVLAGKIVFAKDTPTSGKVVIVENKNGIHTIYAHLSAIAPTIKVGKNIKQGYVLGRVLKDLTFEVTQKNFHINPLELIR